jgi:hypothetical protein
LAGNYLAPRRSRTGTVLLIPNAINTAAILSTPVRSIGFQVLHDILAVGSLVLRTPCFEVYLICVNLGKLICVNLGKSW